MILTLLCPLGVAIICAEAHQNRCQGTSAYAWSHVKTNLTCGLARGLAAVATQGTLAALYHMVQSSWGAWALSAQAPSTWVLGLIAYDLLYYWEHRLAHRHHGLWAVHAVHHQPTEYNLTVGFRSGILAPLSAFPFFLPLALMGIPAEVYLGIMMASTGAMFLLHSNSLGDFGVLGALLNHPEAHRRHHAPAEPANFGGIFIVWDRLFGTYRSGEKTRTFGLSKPAPQSVWAANIEPLRAWWSTLDRDSVVEGIKCVGVYLTVAGSIRALVWVAPSPWVLLALLLPAMFLTDFVSGLAHWLLDQRVSPDSGRLAWLARGFHVHHDRPGACARLPFYESTWEAAVFLGPITLALTLLAGPGVWSTLAVWVTTLGLLAPTTHKLAHRRSRSRLPRFRWRPPLHWRRPILTPSDTSPLWPTLKVRPIAIYSSKRCPGPRKRCSRQTAQTPSWPLWPQAWASL